MTAQPSLPTGTVTFLYTDLEGSTHQWERQPAAMRAAVDRHTLLLRAAIQAQGGNVFRSVGDGLCAAFTNAPAALAAAVATQRALQAEVWGAAGPLRVRLALHTGAVEVQDGDYVGACLNRLGRLLAATHGGQVVLSQATADLVQDALPEGVSLRDLGQHRLRDLQRPERVFQALHPDLVAGFPPLRSLDARPNNLPLQLTSFVGREPEIAEAVRLLAATRLLTLAGPGGVGKTRLAFEVAARAAAAHPDGVWLVDLAPLADADRVPGAVAAVVGVREERDEHATATLARALGGRRLLLVLDNCEHLVAACAELASALLRGGPEPRILATSREPLGVGGELLWPVPPLALPPEPGAPDVPGASVPRGSHRSRVAHSEAVRLFVERAAGARPDFALTDRNAGAVARICRRLDGLPLALELAAARVRAFQVEDVAARLEAGTGFLPAGSRTTPERQRTLRATLDWSHGLLAESERVVFRRLAVFAGGWTPEAAEEVCAGGGIAPDGVLDLLAGLVDKSLVAVAASGAGTRHRLLETVRADALERLAAAGEEAAARSAHARHYLALAESAAPRLLGPDQVVWFDRIEAEHANLRAALGRALEGGAAEEGLRLAVALFRFWEVRGHLAEAEEWLGALLVAAPAADGAVRGRALVRLGHAAVLRADLARSRALGEEALALARAAGDAPTMAYALHLLGATAAGDGALERAEAYLRESLANARARGDGWGAARALSVLGTVALRRGALEEAWVRLSEGLAEARLAGERRIEGVIVSFLSILARQRGDAAGAEAFEEARLEITGRIGDRGGAAQCLAVLGELALERGDAPRARARLAESLRLTRETGGAPQPTGLEGVARLAALRDDAATALRLAGALDAQRHVARLGIPELGAWRLADAEAWLGRARERLGPAAAEAAIVAGRGLPLARAMDEALAWVEADAAADDRVGSAGPLSPREREVAALVAQGRTNKDIGAALVIAEPTVERHLANIFNKLGMHSRAQLAAWVAAQPSEV